MKKIRIRDEKKSDPWSGINILDPQHWFSIKLIFFSLTVCRRIRSSKFFRVTLKPNAHETAQKTRKHVLQLCLKIQFWIHIGVPTLHFRKKGQNRCALIMRIHIQQPWRGARYYRTWRASPPGSFHGEWRWRGSSVRPAAGPWRYSAARTSRRSPPRKESNG